MKLRNDLNNSIPQEEEDENDFGRSSESSTYERDPIIDIPVDN